MLLTGVEILLSNVKTSDEFAVVHPPTTRATLLWQSPSSRGKESLRVTETMIFLENFKIGGDHFQPQILYYISFLVYFGVFVVFFCVALVLASSVGQNVHPLVCH